MIGFQFLQLQKTTCLYSWKYIDLGTMYIRCRCMMLFWSWSCGFIYFTSIASLKSFAPFSFTLIVCLWCIEQIFDLFLFQVVIMQFEGGATASFTTTAFTEKLCVRQTRIFGTKVRWLKNLFSLVILREWDLLTTVHLSLTQVQVQGLESPYLSKPSQPAWPHHLSNTEYHKDWDCTNPHLNSIFQWHSTPPSYALPFPCRLCRILFSLH